MITRVLHDASHGPSSDRDGCHKRDRPRHRGCVSAREGARVVLAGRRERDGRDVVKEIHDAGGIATFVRTDVTVESDVEALVQTAIGTYGRVDLAFNNAGIGETSHDLTHTKSAEDYHRIMNVNVLGVLLSLKHELRCMLDSGSGAIVNNASVTGVVGFPGSALYVASKHAVIGPTKAAALEYAAKAIRVNAIAPGGTETPLLDRITNGLGSESHRRFAQNISSRGSNRSSRRNRQRRIVALFGGVVVCHGAHDAHRRWLDGAVILMTTVVARGRGRRRSHALKAFRGRHRDQ